MMKSLMYLTAILVSFVFLLVGGVLAGSLLFNFSGLFIDSLINDSHAAFYRSWSAPVTLAGAVSGGVASLCWWFKIVGYIVELENISLTENNSRTKEISFADIPVSLLKEAEPFIGVRDARLGNHVMMAGTVVFLASVIYFSKLSFATGFFGILFMLAGFFTSLAAHEYPSEHGIRRRILLLLRNKRPS